jgi:hypothetical protein
MWNMIIIEEGLFGIIATKRKSKLKLNLFCR